MKKLPKHANKMIAEISRHERIVKRLAAKPRTTKKEGKKILAEMRASVVQINRLCLRLNSMR